MNKLQEVCIIIVILCLFIRILVLIYDLYCNEKDRKKYDMDLKNKEVFENKKKDILYKFNLLRIINGFIESEYILNSNNANYDGDAKAEYEYNKNEVEKMYKQINEEWKKIKEEYLDE